VKFARVYSGEDGRSHFEDVEELPPEVKDDWVESKVREATDVRFRHWTEGHFSDLHPSETGGYLIPISGGQLEIGVGSGVGVCKL